jgi:hypothetical protein
MQLITLEFKQDWLIGSRIFPGGRGPWQGHPVDISAGVGKDLFDDLRASLLSLGAYLHLRSDLTHLFDKNPLKWQQAGLDIPFIKDVAEDDEVVAAIKALIEDSGFFEHVHTKTIRGGKKGGSKELPHRSKMRQSEMNNAVTLPNRTAEVKLSPFAEAFRFAAG